MIYSTVIPFLTGDQNINFNSATNLLVFLRDLFLIMYKNACRQHQLSWLIVFLPENPEKGVRQKNFEMSFFGA